MFWQEQCPARGPSLTHQHSSKCSIDHDPAHSLNQCCECGEFSSRRSQPNLVMSDTDIAARYRSLGLTAPEGRNDEATRKEDEFVEPKAAAGWADFERNQYASSPTGPKYGLGRGEVTPRALARAKAYLGWRQWLADHGGGEDVT